MVDGTSRLVAVGFDGDAADELLNDRVLLGRTGAVDPPGQAVEQLLEAATLSCLRTQLADSADEVAELLGC